MINLVIAGEAKQPRGYKFDVYLDDQCNVCSGLLRFARNDVLNTPRPLPEG